MARLANAPAALFGPNSEVTDALALDFREVLVPPVETVNVLLSALVRLLVASDTARI